MDPLAATAEDLDACRIDLGEQVAAETSFVVRPFAL